MDERSAAAARWPLLFFVRMHHRRNVCVSTSQVKSIVVGPPPSIPSFASPPCRCCLLLSPSVAIFVRGGDDNGDGLLFEQCFHCVIVYIVCLSHIIIIYDDAFTHSKQLGDLSFSLRHIPIQPQRILLLCYIFCIEICEHRTQNIFLCACTQVQHQYVKIRMVTYFWDLYLSDLLHLPSALLL